MATHPLSGQKVTIKKLGKRGRLAEMVLAGGDDPAVTVQWGADWLLVARDDPDCNEQHVVGLNVDQVRSLLPILQSFVKRH